MNLAVFKSTYRKVALLILVAFLAVGLFGLSQGMDMGKEKVMTNCIFNMGTAICNMNASEHIQAWQTMFTSLPLKNISLIALLLLLATFALFYLQNLLKIADTKLVLIYNQRFKKKTFFIHSILQEAFSNGILNPKLF